MPQPSSAVESSAFLRLLVLGAPKCGKTHTCIVTAPPGGIYVINSDDQYSLKPAARACDDAGRTFTWDLARGDDANGIEACIKEARRGVKDGEYSTIVWDTISRYSDRIQEVYLDATNNAAGEPDGRRAWPRYKKHLHQIIDRLFMLKAHVVVLSHYIESSAVLIEGQVKKAGEGVLPGLGGAARTSIPAEFQDIVFLEKRGGKREFVISSDGVFGPGCRSLRDVGTHEADVAALWRSMNPAAAGAKKAKRIKE